HDDRFDPRSSAQKRRRGAHGGGNENYHVTFHDLLLSYRLNHTSCRIQREMKRVTTSVTTVAPAPTAWAVAIASWYSGSSAIDSIADSTTSVSSRTAANRGWRSAKPGHSLCTAVRTTSFRSMFDIDSPIRE